jgi:hypothetical protein
MSSEKYHKSKKELQAQYKEREVIGGIYVIRNILNNRLLLGATVELRGNKNRFDFSQKTGSCVELKLQSDWAQQGGGQFVFEIMEELRKGDTQTMEEFKVDVDLLKEMWFEKLSGSDFY